MLPKEGLSEALVDPAVATLRQRGAEVRLGSRIAALVIEDGRVAALRGPEGTIAVGPGDAVLLAAPPWVAADLLPGLSAPDAFEAILNIHFRHAADPHGPLARAGFIGLTSGLAEWLFMKPGHVSVTISAANGRVDDSAHAIASAVWPDVADALGLDAAMKSVMPPYRVVKESARLSPPRPSRTGAGRPRARPWPPTWRWPGTGRIPACRPRSRGR